MENDILLHYGIKRKSGRYPWGSGENPYQRSADFIAILDGYRAEGYSDKEIASKLGMTTNQMKIERQRAHELRMEHLIDSAVSMKSRGMSNVDIAKELGVTEGSVRNYIRKAEAPAKSRISNTADILEKRIGEVGHLEVGKGVERQMGISRTQLKAAIEQLKEKGYHFHELYFRRLDDFTKNVAVQVLSKEKDRTKVYKESQKIQPVQAWTDDGGITFVEIGPMISVNSNRIDVAYAEDGGPAKDGLIEIRRGAEGLDLGTSTYAQVRIPVDDTHFLKGMAIYSDDLPKGVDIRYNVTKSKKTHSKHDTFKKLESDPKNPFGTGSIERQRGSLYILNEEGDWNTWSKTLSSQFLSKQPVTLIKDRLEETYKNFVQEYEEINNLTNAAVKKHLLDGYIDDMGAKARHLKVQGLPRTKSHVILPYPDMNPNEVYAPNYRQGENVVLIRHPHGGRFEIPELKVNNNSPSPKKQLGNSMDAIGIHPSQAQKLSGADFDGDTVLVIPNRGEVKSMRSLKGLKNFDPMQYQVDRPTMSSGTKDNQMGEVSNLITDMTLKGATPGELARAVRHSMVVIDAEKHNLDYKKSQDDNGIIALKNKYQKHLNPLTGKVSRGASTLISLSKRKVPVEDSKGRITRTPIVDMFDDVHKLSSGTAAEKLYADYVNDIKKLTTKAKKEYDSTPNTKWVKEARTVYNKEIKSLDKKLNTALLNAPREREAQIKAINYYYDNRKEDMSKDDNKKLKSRAIAHGRASTGAKKQLIEITDKEWEAIQSGAISNTKLKDILNNTDMEKVKELATPRDNQKLSSARAARARGMLDRGYTYAEVADALGVSVTTIRNDLDG